MVRQLQCDDRAESQWTAAKGSLNELFAKEKEKQRKALKTVRGQSAQCTISVLIRERVAEQFERDLAEIEADHERGKHASRHCC